MNLSILSNTPNINWSKGLNSGLSAFYKLELLQQKKTKSCLHTATQDVTLGTNSVHPYLPNANLHPPHLPL